MAEFEPALKVLLEHEGGYSNDPDDPGLATNHGWSLRTLQKMGDVDGDGWLEGDLDRDGDVDVDDIKILDPETAGHYYKTQFWDRYKYGEINDQLVATKVLLLSVHAGPRRCHLVLQKALHYHTVIRIDGLIGPMTRQATNMVGPSRLLTEFRHETAAFYRELMNKRSGLWKYSKGWMNRAYA